MKTNHQRAFVERYYDFRDRIGWSYTKSLGSGGKASAGVLGNDFHCGIHGYARQRRGAKRRLVSLDRCDAKDHIKNQLAEL